VQLRGRIVRPQLWNPHDGSVVPVGDVRYRQLKTGIVTEFRLMVKPVSTLAVVSPAR
jgi:hypothetical protein